METIKKYDHPYVTVDAVIFRFMNEHLQILLSKRSDNSEVEGGKWCLPGGFCGVESRLMDTLEKKVLEKTGISPCSAGFYVEQLKTYDGINRDSRGRIISVAYLCLTNNSSLGGCWFTVDRTSKTLMNDTLTISFDELAFDHGDMVWDAVIRLAGKLWYTDIVQHLLPPKFTLRESQILCEAVEGFKTNNIGRKFGRKIEGTGSYMTYGAEGGRPAELYRWTQKGEP